MADGWDRRERGSSRETVSDSPLLTLEGSAYFFQCSFQGFFLVCALYWWCTHFSQDLRLFCAIAIRDCCYVTHPVLWIWIDWWLTFWYGAWWSFPIKFSLFGLVLKVSVSIGQISSAVDSSYLLYEHSTYIVRSMSMLIRFQLARKICRTTHKDLICVSYREILWMSTLGICIPIECLLRASIGISTHRGLHYKYVELELRRSQLPLSIIRVVVQ